MAIRIVLFDDNRKFRESLSVLIKSAPGLALAAAYPDAVDVLQKIGECTPDLVLMDIGMPGVRGVEALNTIKKKYPDLPVLMQTVFEDDELIFDAICNGASGYILKNMPPAQLLVAISECYYGGAPMSSSIAKKVMSLLQATKKQEKPPEVFLLTAREQEVLKLMVNGMSYKMIAAHCSISFETVRTHIKNIYGKLHVVTMTEAVAKAVRNNLG